MTATEPDLQSRARVTAEEGLLRVLVVADTYLPVVGGAERLLAALMGECRRRGIEIHVVVPEGAVEGERAGPEVILAPARRTPLGWLVSPRWLRSEMKSLGTQVVQTSGPSLIEWSALLARPRDVPILSLYHCHLDLTKRTSRVANWGHVRILLPRFDGQVTVSPLVARDLREREPRLRPRTVVTGLSAGRIFPDISSRDKGSDVLFIGRLPATHAQKRPDLLVRAFALAAQGLCHARLHIVGDGPGRLDLEKLSDRLNVRDRTIFHGYVPESEQHFLFEQAGCLVLPSPSLSEGLSLVVIDALAHRVPVVLSEQGGGSFVVRETGIGALCKPNDVDSLASAICRTVDGHRRGEFDPLFSKAGAMFSSSRMASEYIELWNRSLEGKVEASLQL